MCFCFLLRGTSRSEVAMSIELSQVLSKSCECDPSATFFTLQLFLGMLLQNLNKLSEDDAGLLSLRFEQA